MTSNNWADFCNDLHHNADDRNLKVILPLQFMGLRRVDPRWRRTAVSVCVCLNKISHLYFLVISAKVVHFSQFFTVMFRKDLCRKSELKLTHHLKSVSALC